MITKIIVMLVTLLLLSGCNEAKREEALAIVNNIECEKTGIGFILNGLWEVEEEKDHIELSAKNIETDSHILVFYDDIKEKEGGDVIREEDYINNMIENLKVSQDYSYSIKEQEKIKLFDKSFTTFLAQVDSMNATQKYFINNSNGLITLMVITSYGEEEISEILSLANSK